jgi:hypothetical protein
VSRAFHVAVLHSPSSPSHVHGVLGEWLPGFPNLQTLSSWIHHKAPVSCWSPFSHFWVDLEFSLIAHDSSV